MSCSALFAVKRAIEDVRKYMGHSDVLILGELVTLSGNCFGLLNDVLYWGELSDGVLPYTYVCDCIYLTLHLRVRVFVCSLFTRAVVNRVVGIASYLNMEIYYIQSAALRKYSLA